MYSEVNITELGHMTDARFDEVSTYTTNYQAGVSNNNAATATFQPNDTTITEQQISSIRKLSEYLGKAEPERLTAMSNLDAKKVIQQLTTEYRQSKKAS